MRKDSLGYELRSYRVVYAFRVGYIADLDRRTWAEKLYCEVNFPTMEQAMKYRDYPDCLQDKWFGWRTKYDHGKIENFSRRGVHRMTIPDPSSHEGPKTLWLHVKTGSHYKILHMGLSEKTLESVVIYQQYYGIGPIWVLPWAEFFDGRFRNWK